MGTKFILHGGFTPGKTDEDNSAFYKEILKDAPEEARILLVPFAKDTDRVLGAVTKVSSELHNSKWQKSISIEVANEQDFIQQLQTADVVYFHGGTSIKLFDALQHYSGLKDALTDKTVAGESAGANVTCSFFYSPRSDVVSPGLGMLPVKIIPHYISEYEDKLSKVGTDLETVHLPEYAYKVFYK